jgi:hypothetical protein
VVQLALAVTPGLVAGIAAAAGGLGILTRMLVRLAARRSDR